MATLTQLEYILAVDKHRHFGKAARECHISQPTLSQQIQKLEDELSIIIFDRIQKPVVATEDGKIFIAQAKKVIREHQVLLHVAKKGSEGVNGEFRLGIIPTLSSQLIPLFIRDFSQNFPKVELYIEELKTETILTELKSDRLDGAILATPLHQPGLKEHPLFYEAFYAYFAEGHPLLKKEFLTSSDLDPTEMWMLQDGNCFKKQIANFCQIGPDADGTLRNIHFQSGSLETLKNVIKNNFGYTLIPSLMTRQMSAAEIKAHVRTFKAPNPSREVSFVYRRDHWKLDMIQAIESTIQKSLPNEVNHELKTGQILVEHC